MTPDEARFLAEHPERMPRAMREYVDRGLAEAEQRRRSEQQRPVQPARDRPVDWGQPPAIMSETARSEALRFAEGVHQAVLGRLKLGTRLNQLAASMAAVRASEWKYGDPPVEAMTRLAELEAGGVTDWMWAQAWKLSGELLDDAGIAYPEVSEDE